MTRRHGGRLRWTLTAAVAAALLLTGCGSGGAAETPDGTGPGAAAEGGVLRIGTTTDVANWAPLNTTSITDMWVLNQLFPSLVTVGPDGELIPHLASSYEVNEAGDAVTIALDPDFAWSDGEPITADDVVYTLDQMREHTLIEGFSFIGSYAETVVNGPHDIVVKLSSPSVGMVDNFLFNMRVMPAHVYEDVPDITKLNISTDERYWVSGGSFTLSKVTPGQRYEFVRNEHYPLSAEGNEAVTGVEFDVYRDMNTMQLALQNGDLDLAAPGVPPTAVAPLSQQPDVEIISTENAGNFTRLMFNTHNPALGDVAVRNAIAGLIDNQQLVDNVLLGQGSVVTGPLPALQSTGLPDFPGHTVTPEEAEKTLADAGYAGLSLDLVCDQGNANHLKTAQLVRDDLAEAGITVNLKCAERATARATAAEGKFDLYVIKASSPYSAATVMSVYNHTTNWLGVNWGAAGDAETDALMDAALAATDPDAYTAAVAAAATRLDEQQYMVSLFTESLNVAYNSRRFTGYLASPFEQWSLVNAYSLSQVVPTGKEG
ncbi:ABC transporter substrate-binding protein [Microbacterium sp. No. 7]|uniref:ABC transporter substrate-binding protein n=1 Tax=Microbacterium sp. No. 7 TaxID=1714373 RepID=UPI0006D115C7|nr:ABC transporter substrate-binding protein [Microbacterium sp. No. 7]ALJ19312.1 hypothetical protein AOA12_05085 [Microbacterium sp. No. 7]